MPTGRLLAAACFALDCALVALVALSVAILVTGGFVIDVGSLRVRGRTLTNPVLIAAALLVGRYFLRTHLPFLGLRSLRLDDIGRDGLSWTGRLIHEGLPVRLVLGSLIVLAVVVKLGAAWYLPGFFSGDDVEVHEMTLSALFGADWPIWELRSPFFPLTFVYPAQWVAHSAGITDSRSLVFAGRAVVALLSTLVIPLTYIAARRVTPTTPAVAVMAAALVTANKLQMSFGSTELPRPVASVFVLGAFILLLSRRTSHGACAGILVGAAAAFRFSEAMFVLPALVMLRERRRWLEAGVMLTAAAATAALVIGMADLLYWGTPFASVVKAVDYTLIQDQSSRGYEPFFQYVVLTPQWTNWFVFALAIAGSIRAWTVGAWLWLPVIVLSALPHKETRYLIPVIPYLCLAAAVGIHRVVHDAQTAWPAARAHAAGALLLPLLSLGLLQDIGGWRLARSNDEVMLARRLAGEPGGNIAIRGAWRLGGRIYLGPRHHVIEIEDASLATPESRQQLFRDVRWIVVDPETAKRLGPDDIRALGFEHDESWTNPWHRLYTKRLDR
jgi:hypothetical protein